MIVERAKTVSKKTTMLLGRYLYLIFKKLWFFFLLELFRLAKNATLKDVLDEIKKNRKFSKNEALFCKQKETENMDGIWILNFNRLHITTLYDCWIYWSTSYYIFHTKNLLSIWFFIYFIIFSPIWKHLSQHNSQLGLTFDP